MEENRREEEAFLASVEKRAFRMAQMAVGNREDALDIVQEAMFGWVRRYRHKPDESWKPLFYRVLNSRISDWHRRRRVRDQLRKMIQKLIRGLTITALAACLALVWPAPPCPAAEGGVPWHELDKEEQAILGRLAEKWDDLSPERQQRLLKGARRWQAMTPQQREQAQQRLKSWKNLSPERRENIRKRYQWYKSLPPEEQARLKEARQRYLEMPEEDRRELRRRWQNIPPERRRAIRERWLRMTPEERQEFIQ